MRRWKSLLVLGAGSLAACVGGGNAVELPDSGLPLLVVPVTPDDAGTPTVDAGPPLQPIVDLRVDVNRNGVVDLDDPTEDEGEDTWTAERGAVFLANIDDDTKRCPVMQTAIRPLPDKELAACHDAADDVVNGNNDLLDMARVHIKPWPDAPDGTMAVLDLSGPADAYVRLFRNVHGTFTHLKLADARFTAEDLRAGVEMALEGKDIVRDREVWNGIVDITLVMQVPAAEGRAQFNGSDTVRLRLAPVITFHHSLPAENVFVTQVPRDPDSTTFVNDLSTAVGASAVSKPLTAISDIDQWTQDYFEPGYMSMPSPSGQHTIRINYRSANLEAPASSRPLRAAGVVVFRMRGPDVAAIQEWDPSANRDMDSLNSFGNTETIPPYELNGVKFPLGRVFRGSTSSFYPDRRFSKMMEAQAVQPPVYVDTSWLVVGHVDETISFLKANTPRGWVAMVNDPRLARTMLEDVVNNGNGSAKMFVGKKWLDDFNREYPAEVSVSQVLSNSTVMNESAVAAAEVDAQLAILKKETGLTDQEIIRVPFLHDSYGGYSVAYQPGTVNSLVLNDKFLVAPDPFGPVINGKDIFKEQLEAQLAPLGYTIHWVDDWNRYHRLLGEVHCGTNAARAIPETKWWESGR